QTRRRPDADSREPEADANPAAAASGGRAALRRGATQEPPRKEMSVDFGRLLRALRSGDVEFLIIGGVAAAIHGSARTTLDLDILYRRTRENLACLVRSLTQLNPYLLVPRA